MLVDFEIEMTGRKFAADYIKGKPAGDMYLFGIWSGCSVKDTLDYMDKNNVEYDNVYGFDSFIGLPDETAGINKYHNFNKGSYSSAELYKESDVKKVIALIKKGINNNKLKLIPGYFNVSLKKTLIKKHELKPASFIDIDVDLHISTVQIFDFMFTNKLIQAGTIIYFDDWGGIKEGTGGESLAWREIAEKYNVKFKEIFDNKISMESVQKVFLIEDYKI